MASGSGFTSVMPADAACRTTAVMSMDESSSGESTWTLTVYQMYWPTWSANVTEPAYAPPSDGAKFSVYDAWPLPGTSTVGAPLTNGRSDSIE